MVLKKHESVVSKPSAARSPPKLRLLYVEDEEVNYEVTLLHLKERYDVSLARDADEAFNLLRTTDYHAILMDIQLSNSALDGIGITKVLRGTYVGELPQCAVGIRSTKVPIIFMTAYSARYSKDELVQQGGDEMVTKPVDFTLLGLTLSRCLLKNMK